MLLMLTFCTMIFKNDVTVHKSPEMAALVIHATQTVQSSCQSHVINTETIQQLCRDRAFLRAQF